MAGEDDELKIVKKGRNHNAKTKQEKQIPHQIIHS
jgi:23S rRNA maturation mini-RNase III